MVFHISQKDYGFKRVLDFIMEIKEYQNDNGIDFYWKTVMTFQKSGNPLSK